MLRAPTWRDVDVALHHLELAQVHDLGHELQAVAVGGPAQHLQTVFAVALEAVGGAAGLEGAAAQDLGARLANGRRGRVDLRLVLGRARARHDDDLVAADAHVIEHDDGVVRLEGPTRQLVRLGDPEDFVHAFQHLNQPRIGLPVAAHGPEDRSERTGRPVHVVSHLEEVRHDLLDLLLGRPLPHHYHHVGLSLILSGLFRRLWLGPAGVLAPPIRATGPFREPVFIRLPLEPARFVDDPFEQPADRLRVQRAAVGRHHVLEHLTLAGRLVDRHAELFLAAPQLERTAGPLVQQPHDFLIQRVDLAPQVGERIDHVATPDFSQRTSAATRAARSGAWPASAITFTSALPTTAASAIAHAAWTCSGRRCRTRAPPASTSLL
jgi:hypothetical protein